MLSKRNDSITNFLAEIQPSQILIHRFSKLQISNTGAQQIIGVPNEYQPQTIYNCYNGAGYGFDYITINHRGYVYATQLAPYTSSTGPPDDIALLWLG